MFSINYQNSFTLAFNMAAQNHARQQAIVADVEDYRLHLNQQCLAQRARQPCAPAPLVADIGDPSTSQHAESVVSDKASEAAIGVNLMSSNDNESEEGWQWRGGGQGRSQS
jgi:hypothetical protein